MKILVINPVGHTLWNESDKALYKGFLPVDIDVDVVSLPKGPKSVETVEAYNEVTPKVVEVGRNLFSKYYGLIVNCFLDPGVDELRHETRGIVLGAGEASLTLAKLYGRPVYIITPGSEKDAINLMWSNVKKLNFEKFVVDIIGIPMRVVDIDVDKEKTIQLLLKTVSSIVSRENKAIIVLGCTGFGGMAEELENSVKVPVIDPVKACALLMTSLLKLVKIWL